MASMVAVVEGELLFPGEVVRYDDDEIDIFDAGGKNYKEEVH